MPTTPVPAHTLPPPFVPARRCARLLLIEDDPDIARVIDLHLRDVHCSIEVCGNGFAALDHVLNRQYDAILLDLTLPEIDGVTICQAIRTRNIFTPIMMITARSAETDRVVGLEVGADDYLTKPFSLRELQARVKALLRRATHYAAPSPAQSDLSFDDLVIGLDRREVTLSGQLVDLTAKEFELLAWFAQHPGRVFTREQLLDAIWGYAHAGYGHTVNSHINRLRAKIERDPAEPSYILTVWSVGYKFRDVETR